MIDKRVKFDFEIYFTNGGSIKGEDFRFDISGDDISDKELVDYIVDNLRLFMVGEIKILNKVIFA
jgi:arylformamidase